MSFTLRDYQDDAVVSVRLAYREDYKAVILVLSTGAGKTVIFSYIAKSAAEKGRKILILAHRDQLIKQASRKLKDYDVKHGIIMAGYTPDRHSRVQVASVQTLVRRLDKTKSWFKPDLIVIDEAHLSAANSYRKVLEAFPDALVLGVTGSPCRLDNKPLGKEFGGIYDHMIEGISISQLMDRGFLVRPKVYAPAEQLDLSGIKKSMGDYDTQELAAVVDKPKITGNAVAHYQKICPGAPAIAWCVTVEHAQHVAEEFCRNGIKAIMLCGEDPGDVRDRALKGLETGEVQVICFVGILVEGVDCPAIACVISLRPTMSLASYLQVIGRSLRTIYAPGMPIGTDEERLAAISAGVKPCAFFLDHSGLTFRHGLVDEPRDWSLDWGEKKKGKKKQAEKPVDIVQCKGCFACFSPAPACPHCGKPVEVKARKLDHVDGELHEITPEMAERMKRQKKQEVKGAKTLEELQKIAAQRGYSAGWAKHAFEAKQRTAAKYQRPQRPPEPSLDELKTMTLYQLEVVSAQQGWASDWAIKFFNSQQALGGQ